MTTKALGTLRQVKEDLASIETDRDQILNDLVKALIQASKDTGQSVNALIKTAGISRQTFYLRIKGMKSDLDTEETKALDQADPLETLAKLRAQLAIHDTEVARLKKERAKLIVKIPLTYSAVDIADAAGVTAIWVRALRRGSVSSLKNHG